MLSILVLKNPVNKILHVSLQREKKKKEMEMKRKKI